jgi:predicted Rossmann fold nucleotide-binding protein DprA/Smf involved in DNA uptake
MSGMHSQRDDARASLLLTDRSMAREGKPLAPGEYWKVLRALDNEPAKLLGADVSAFAKESAFFEKNQERLAQLLKDATRLAFHVEQLERSGFFILTPFDEEYPERLRERLGDLAPPVLYGVGPKRLLSAVGVGIVGSRDASDEAVEVAREAGERVARARLTVISGGAKGVDQIAMRAALGAGGDVVGVLAGWLERRVREPEVRRLVAEEQLCLVTPYAPSVGFSVGNAMGRNKLIYALARSTFVVCAGDRKGGTWEGASEALSSGFCPVLAWLGPGRGPGNEQLIEKGAVPVDELDRLVDVALSASMPTRASRSRARRGGSGRGRPLAGESDRQLGLGFG